MLLFFISTLLIQINFIAPDVQTTNWETDYALATAKAKAEDKMVFMLFTGSDWCMSCKRLRKKVLASDDFQTFADQNLVLLEIDFPRNNRNQDLEQIRQNELLAKKYNKEGAVPKIIIMQDGHKVGQIMYRGESTNAFIKKLTNLIDA
jgi:thiol:disulfide interchange protein